MSSCCWSDACAGVLCCRLLTYLTAVSEYCAALNSNLTLCQSEPLCQVILFAGNATVHAASVPAWATAGDWLQAVTQHTHHECWPDWLRILNQECAGSRESQVKQCLPSLWDRNAADGDRGMCSSGCMFMKNFGVFSCRYVGACLPPWMLHELCGNRSRLITAAAAAIQQEAAANIPHCENDYGGDSVLDYTCSFATAFAMSTSWTEFQGSCPHRRAVAQLLRAVPDAFSGHGGCSLEQWVSTTPEAEVARAHICNILPGISLPRSEFKEGDYRRLWVPESLAQVALLQCASGYMHMHAALSTLWRSPALYIRLLNGSGSWSRALPHAGQVCRAHCVANGSQVPASVTKSPWDLVEGVLALYCSSALALKAAARVLPLADSSQFGCADALKLLKQNWLQHQLLAILWLVYVVGLVVGLLACWLLRHVSDKHLHCCGASQQSTIVCGSWESFIHRVSPSYHASTPHQDHSKSTSGCTIYRVLSIVRACWYSVDVAISVGVFFEMFTLRTVFLTSNWGLPTPVVRAIGWWVWWLLAVVCAPFLVTMLLIAPSVLSAYGLLDFARMRISMKWCFLLFFSFAWVVLLGIVFGVGAWFVVIADLYMLIELWGLPKRKLLGNKLNVNAYTTLRLMCQGLVHALPSALICTAIIDALLVTTYNVHVVWASLLLSMSRFAWEVFSLAMLTHRLGASCFISAIVDVVHHLQPGQSKVPCEASALPCTPLSEVSVRGHDGHNVQAGLASPGVGHASGQREGPSVIAHVAQGRNATPTEIDEMPSMQAEEPAASGVADGQALAASTQTAVHLHNTASAFEGTSCCSTWGERASWPQQYPRFTVVHVWVVSLLVGAFVCVACSHIIWPYGDAWVYVGLGRRVDTSYLYSVGYKRLPAASVRPYSLLGLWGNWSLSASEKGSVAALGSCGVRDITCNLTAA